MEKQVIRRCIYSVATIAMTSSTVASLTAVAKTALGRRFEKRLVCGGRGVAVIVEMWPSLFRVLFKHTYTYLYCFWQNLKGVSRRFRAIRISMASEPVVGLLNMG